MPTYASGMKRSKSLVNRTAKERRLIVNDKTLKGDSKVVVESESNGEQVKLTSNTNNDDSDNNDGNGCAAKEIVNGITKSKTSSELSSKLNTLKVDDSLFPFYTSLPDDVFENLVSQSVEQSKRLSVSCYLGHKKLSWNMKISFLKWISYTIKELSIAHDIIFYASFYIDVFLSHTKMIIDRSTFQIVGAAAMLIATKMNHVNCYSINPRKLANLSSGNFRIPDLLEMESEMLKVLSFRLIVVTPIEFLTELLKRENNSSHLFAELCYEVAEFSLLAESLMDVDAFNRAKLSIEKASLLRHDRELMDNFLVFLESRSCGRLDVDKNTKDILSKLFD